MDDKSTDFPQYRKLTNGLRFYKINSANEFEELQILGENVYYYKITAEQYPEKLRIMDMLDENLEFYLKIDAFDWDQQSAKI